jgi:hypothetical protein
MDIFGGALKNEVTGKAATVAMDHRMGMRKSGGGRALIDGS